MGKARRRAKARHGHQIYVARVMVVALAASLLPAPQAIAADDAAASAADAVNPSFDPTMPKQWDASKIYAQGMLFQGCGGNLQTGISQSLQTFQNMITSGGGQSTPPLGGAGINAVCPGTDVVPGTESLSCESFSRGGSFSMNALKAMSQSIDVALLNIQCRKGKLDAVRGELSCLTTQAEMLQQQLASIQAAYQTNLQRFEQDAAKIDTVIADREAQSRDVLEKLGGSGGEGGNGSKGLLGMRDELQKALTSVDPNQGIPGAIQQLKDEMKQTELMQKDLDASIQDRVMGLASECFKQRKQGGFRCEPNGPLVSASEYVVCRYQQNQSLSGGSDAQSRETNQIQVNQASSRAAELQNLLDQIFSETPQKLAQGGGGQAQFDPSAPAATLLSAADIEDRYGAQLAEFDKAGFEGDGQSLPIHDFVMKNVSYCYSRAQRTVDFEKTRNNSAIGANKNALERQMDGLRVKANTMIETHSQLWAQAMTTLTGLHLPLNTGACKNATPTAQINCLTDLKNNLEGILDGNVKQAGVEMLIKGTDARTNIGFSCQGINGCIAALQNVDRNLRTEKQRLRTYKADYVMKARQSAQNFTHQMASMMSAQSAALMGRLKSLNAAMSTMGIRGIDIPTVRGEEMQFGENGLPLPPSSAVQLIGGQMNPPMLDVNGNNFSSALDSVAEGSKDLDDKLGPILQAKQRIAELPAECSAQKVRDLIARTQRHADIFTSGNCGMSRTFCEKTSQTALQKLIDDVAGTEPGGGLDEASRGDVEQTLQMGFQVCSEQQAEEEQRRKLASESAKSGQTLLYTPSSERPNPQCAAVSSLVARDWDAIGRARKGSGEAGAGDAR